MAKSKALKIGVLGVGRMGSALVKGFLNAGINKRDILASDEDKRKLETLCKSSGIKMIFNNRDLVKEAEIVFVVVKPKDVQMVLEDLGGIWEKLIISTVAGVPIAEFEKRLKKARVIRIMPNLPCSVNEGAIVYSTGSRVGKNDQVLVEKLLSKLGVVIKLPESMLDAVTGLSGSGPAFCCVAMEAMAEAGVEEGLPESTALKLVAQTAKGTSKMILETGISPKEFINTVASPGGTTEAGLKKLEEMATREAFKKAVTVAIKRAKELR